MYNSTSKFIKLSNGVELLQNNINNYLNLLYFECEQCNDIIISTKHLREHVLFIDTEIYFEKNFISLDKLPIEIMAQGKKVYKIHRHIQGDLKFMLRLFHL